jgi:hypothetical protein
LVAFAMSAPADAEQLFCIAIACARERIWLTIAYFAPRRAFVDALCAMRARELASALVRREL